MNEHDIIKKVFNELVTILDESVGSLRLRGVQRVDLFVEAHSAAAVGVALMLKPNATFEEIEGHISEFILFTGYLGLAKSKKSAEKRYSAASLFILAMELFALYEGRAFMYRLTMDELLHKANQAAAQGAD